MVAQEHNNIGHGSELLEYADAVRVSVDYIAQDIEGILGLKIDLFHDRVEAAPMAVDIRHYIDHRGFWVTRTYTIFLWVKLV